MKSSIFSSLILLAFVTTMGQAIADNNNFFGASPSTSNGSASGGGSGSSSGGSTVDNPDYSHDTPDDANPNAVLPGLNSTTPTKPNATDFTGDEKRMQRKYKDNIANAKRLIAKGENMMKSAGNNVHSAAYKKGKIFKEIGEKSLADLTANNPFPDQKTK